jgi:hypothetical protein
MSASDIVSADGAVWLTQAGLVIFLAAFASIVAWTLTRRRGEMDARARAVLDDGEAKGSEGLDGMV